MTIASAVTAALPGLRAEAESLMLDAGKALRPTAGHTYNPATKQDEQAADDLFGPIKCKVQTRNLVPRQTEVGGRTAVSIRTELHLPASTDALRPGDLWEMTAVNDLSLQTVGQRFRIIGPASGSLKTARRYEVEESV